MAGAGATVVHVSFRGAFHDIREGCQKDNPNGNGDEHPDPWLDRRSRIRQEQDRQGSRCGRGPSRATKPCLTAELMSAY
jgi:hypothetical protein